MSHPFWIDRSEFTSVTDPALLVQVRSHTETDDEAESIVRSMQRLIDDSSISGFEMTPLKQNSSRTRRTDWSVRPVRS